MGLREREGASEAARNRPLQRRPGHTYFMYMKAIQVMFDERLLHDLDRDAEVKKDGRSAVLRRAALAYLKRKRRQDVKESYMRAYGKRRGLGAEFDGWEDEGAWPTVRP